MAIDKIALLRISLDTLDRFGPATESAPDGWQARAGEGGGPFAVRAVPGGVLVLPFASFAAADELAVHLRLLLGAALDAHDDARGIRVISHEDAGKGASYDDLVAAEAGAWIPKVAANDERLPRNGGWSFADAARTFASPGTRQRAEVAEGGDPLEKAGDKFGEILDAREDRGALRRTLSAAVDHSLEASALGAALGPRASEADLNTEEPALAGVLARGLKSNPEAANALEATLRKAVDEELADAAGDDAASAEPKEEAR